MREGGPSRLALPLVCAALVAAVAAACGSEQRAVPANLVDGSPVAPLPSRLKDEKSLARGRVEVFPIGRGDRDRLGACLRSLSPVQTSAGRPVVSRTGVEGASLTFADRSGRRVYACDHAPRALEGRYWSASSVGRIPHGRLLDPRLSLVTLKDGKIVAFAWVQPLARTRWLIVDQGSFRELYEVAGGLPVRLTTRRGIDIDRSSAIFDVEQLDRDGRELRHALVTTFVAG
jgi:hypothetical protein